MYYVEVRNGKKRGLYSILFGMSQTFDYRVELASFGMKFYKYSSVGGYWQLKTENKNVVEQIRRFCKHKHLDLRIYTENEKRGDDCRSSFFNANVPIFGNDYVCAYCFKRISKMETVVDHVIPVYLAQTNKYARWLMGKLNINNINDQKNLVAACKECNSKKGKKGGLWIARGFFGKNRKRVIFGYVLREILTIIMLIMIVTMIIFIVAFGYVMIC